MAVSHTLIVAAVLSSLLVCGHADLCAPACSGGSGVFPHPQDCNSFYQCSSGTAILQHCAAGLEFNPIGHYCDYPAQSGCTSDPARECGVAEPSQEVIKCIPDCLTSDAIYPHPQDCTQYFQCFRAEPRLWSCPFGQEYSELLRRCDDPDLSNCTASAESLCLVEEAPNVCAPKCPWPGAYMAHPNDCSKFYICGGGEMPFETSCQPGLIYDMKLLRCDYPSWAYCVARPDRACDEYLRYHYQRPGPV